MSSNQATNARSRPDYLRVDDFLRDLIGVRALASAFELGLIDALADGAALPIAALGPAIGVDQHGTRLLLKLLHHGGVVELTGADDAEAVRLGTAFSEALAFRDLLVARMELALRVTPDFLERFTQLLIDPDAFSRDAALFKLFDYRQALDPSPDNYRATAQWMRHTTVLTRYEAAACLQGHDFSRYRRLLDVGGNSGEFALQLCRRHPQLQAVVRDLPLVCELGAEHLRQQPEASRIAFSSTVAAFPCGFDLVTFKSMLHDWPAAPARAFLAQAWQALDAGGTVLIFERSVDLLDPAAVPYASLPLLLFFRSYRSGGDYRAALAAAGFVDIEMTSVALDLPFLLISARKPGGE